MYRKFTYILTILFISLNINTVNAEMCDKEDILKVKELVKNIPVNYEYVGNFELASHLQEYEVWFDLGELDGKIYIEEAHNKYDKKIYHTNEKITLTSGKKTLYVYYDTCAEIKVGTISFELKKFNEYSIRTECIDELQGQEVCDMWYQGEINEEYFEKLAESNNENDENKIIDIVSKYNIAVLIGIILIFILIVLLYIRSKKKNKLD